MIENSMDPTGRVIHELQDDVNEEEVEFANLKSLS